MTCLKTHLPTYLPTLVYVHRGQWLRMSLNSDAGYYMKYICFKISFKRRRN